MQASANAFDEHREAIIALGYRMLGSRADAEDLAQETYLRWRQAAPEGVQSPRAWLLKAASRLALDRLKSAQRTRLTYVGPWLPEPWLVEEKSPADAAAVDDSVTIALMLAMERLSPAERAAFLLHDVFGFSFEEIGEVLGRNATACRQLAARARSAVRENKPKFELDAERHRALLDAFLAACTGGDLGQIKALLAEDAIAIADGGGKALAARRVLSSADHVGRFCAGVFSKRMQKDVQSTFEFTTFNGLPGVVIRQGGTIVASISAAIVDGRIAQLFLHRNPDKLALFAQQQERR